MEVKITVAPQDYFRLKHLVAAGETLPVEWDVSLLIKTHIRRSEKKPARQPVSSTWCSAELNCSAARLCRWTAHESKWREEAGLQQYTKSPLLYFFVFSLFFNDGNWSPLFVQQKNSFKWLKTQKMQTYQIKSKPILDSVVLPFLSCASSRPRLFSVWFELLAQMCVSSVQRRVLGFSSAVSVWMEVGSWSWVWFCVRSGSVEVRCGWVGARGWTAGCSPPSPWWSSEEQTACWGTTGEERTTVTQTVMSQTSARLHSWHWKK